MIDLETVTADEFNGERSKRRPALKGSQRSFEVFRAHGFILPVVVAVDQTGSADPRRFMHFSSHSEGFREWPSCPALTLASCVNAIGPWNRSIIPWHRSNLWSVRGMRAG